MHENPESVTCALICLTAARGFAPATGGSGPRDQAAPERRAALQIFSGQTIPSGRTLL
jgi:hypothetical protein